MSCRITDCPEGCASTTYVRKLTIANLGKFLLEPASYLYFKTSLVKLWCKSMLRCLGIASMLLLFACASPTLQTTGVSYKVFYINLEKSRSRRLHMEQQLGKLSSLQTVETSRWNASRWIPSDKLLQDFRKCFVSCPFASQVWSGTVKDTPLLPSFFIKSPPPPLS